MKTTRLMINRNLSAMLLCLVFLLLCAACGDNALHMTDGDEYSELDSPVVELTTPPPASMPSQISTPNPTPIPTLTLEYQPIESIHAGALHPTLQSLLDCEDREVAFKSFGEPVSMFRKYFFFENLQAYVRFNESGEEGWSSWIACTRTVHSILLAGKFDGAILPGIYDDSAKKEIIAQLGQPQFESKDPDVFGYKADGFYIFFSDGYGLEGPKRKEVTIYRRPKYDETKLSELLQLLDNDFGLLYNAEEDTWYLDDYEKQEEQIQRVMDFCMTAWPDYDHWFVDGPDKTSSRFRCFGAQYGANGFYISGSGWPNLDIYGNYDGEIFPGVRLHAGTNTIEGLAAQGHVGWHLDKDLVFELEKQRLEENKVFKETCYDSAVLSPDGNAMIYIGDQNEMDDDGVCLWFLDGRRRPVLWEEWHARNFFWLDNRYVIYNYYKSEHILIDTQADRLWEYGTEGIHNLEIRIERGEGYGVRIPIRSVDRRKQTITVGNDDEPPLAVPYSIAADGTVVIGNNFVSPKASVYREGSVGIGGSNYYYLYDEYVWLDDHFIAFINTDGFLSIYDTAHQRYYIVDIPSQNGKALGDSFVSSEGNSLLVEPISLYLAGTLTTRTAMVFTVAIPNSGLPVITLDGTACPLRPWP